MYDKNGTHDKRNKHTAQVWVHGEKQVTLYPMKPKPPKTRLRGRLTKEELQVYCTEAMSRNTEFEVELFSKLGE